MSVNTSSPRIFGKSLIDNIQSFLLWSTKNPSSAMPIWPWNERKKKTKLWNYFVLSIQTSNLRKLPSITGQNIVSAHSYTSPLPLHTIQWCNHLTTFQNPIDNAQDQSYHPNFIIWKRTKISVLSVVYEIHTNE